MQGCKARHGRVGLKAIQNPIAPRPNEGKKIAGYDPLDRWKDETRYDRYDFYRKYQN